MHAIQHDFDFFVPFSLGCTMTVRSGKIRKKRAASSRLKMSEASYSSNTSFHCSLPFKTPFILTEASSPAAQPVCRPYLLRKLCHYPSEAVNFSNSLIFSRDLVSALHSLYSSTPLSASVLAFSLIKETERRMPADRVLQIQEYKAASKSGN